MSSDDDLTKSQVRALARGTVYLVGAGPGDPELLTVRAHRLLSRAQVVAYDELVSDAILALAPHDAERLPVGRRAGTSPDAPSIHPAVLEHAVAGRDVVRLKGGDPMIFGRGGEEAAELAALHVPFEVVPGISAALGAAASMGLPLTHRDAAASVTFATAHRKGGVAAELASGVPPEGTVVLYMGLGTLPETVAALVEGGRSRSTPVCVVSHATLPSERAVIGTLGTIAETVAREALPTPALVIVGEVVARRVASPTAAAAAATALARTAKSGVVR